MEIDNETDGLYITNLNNKQDCRLIMGQCCLAHKKVHGIMIVNFSLITGHLFYIHRRFDLFFLMSF